MSLARLVGQDDIEVALASIEQVSATYATRGFAGQFAALRKSVAPLSRLQRDQLCFLKADHPQLAPIPARPGKSERGEQERRRELFP
jgi:hypothetical protein